MPKESFWETLQKLVDAHSVYIDRPKGSAHPRYAEYTYPFDYGFLEGTTSGDGSGIDVWLGSREEKDIVGVIVVVDLVKKDSEIKVLLGCSDEDMDIILACHKRGSMNAILIKK